MTPMPALRNGVLNVGRTNVADHDCIARIDEQLKDHNTQIAIAFNFVTGALAIQVPTMKLDPSKRGKPAAPYASFCPFCGVSLAASKGQGNG